MSRPCEECGVTKQCRMHLDREKRIVYLCEPCARELGFAK